MKKQDGRKLAQIAKIFYFLPLLLLFAFFSSPLAMRRSANQHRVLVKKGERKLYVYRIDNGKEVLLRTYKIALGSTPSGTKRQQGDGATPEGDYFITHKNSRSKFYLSLGLSYPNAIDATAGMKRGLISKTEYDAIVNAINKREKPPQNTKLGGDIFIHGGGIGSDWTLGCVALENEGIKELFDMLPVKTPVKILP
jgi:murein L,D-transpeptidase YafK